jgi:DNA-binding response OmpR family regulator
VKRRRVLVVEDDATIAELVEAALVDAGYDAIVATNGEGALEAATRTKPHLVLLDLRMPGLDGRGFAKIYREKTRRPAPIAVITAVRDAESVAEEIGAQGFLAKPFDLGELLTLVARLAKG